MAGWFNADGSLKSPYDEQFGLLEYSVKEPSATVAPVKKEPKRTKKRGPGRPKKNPDELMAKVTPERVFGKKN